MTQSVEHRKATLHQLSETELEGVIGGMKWRSGTVNPDVIDARGGSFTLFGFRATFDVNGNLSSVTPIK